MRSVLFLTAAALLAAPLSAQTGFEVRSAAIFERYTFDGGLSFSEVSEFTIPVTATVRFGSRADLTLSSGFARVAVVMANGGDDQVLSGALDSEARLSLTVLPGRLLVLLTGTAPTGMKEFDLASLPALQALATDVIGFAAPALGSGGNVGGGIVAALPIGRMAVGLATSFQLPMSYQPVAGLNDELRPGAELRLRAGLEGAVGARTYLRLTGIYLRRGLDQINGEDANGIGNRIAGYAALDQGIGSSTLTLYGFDLFRANAQIEQTVVGAAVFPRSNVIGAGVQLALPVTRTVQFKPRAEYRGAWQDFEVGGGSFERVGSSLRFGADVRFTVSPMFTLALQGDALTGDVAGDTAYVGVGGFRFGLFLDVRR